MSDTGTKAWQLFVLGGQNSNTDRPAAWGMWAGYPVYRLTAEVPCFPPACVSGWLWMKLARTGRRPVLQRIWGMCRGRVNTALPLHSNPCSFWFPPPQLTSVHMCRQEFTDCCLLAWFVSVSDKGIVFTVWVACKSTIRGVTDKAGGRWESPKSRFLKKKSHCKREKSESWCDN